MIRDVKKYPIVHQFDIARLTQSGPNQSSTFILLCNSGHDIKLHCGNVGLLRTCPNIEVYTHDVCGKAVTVVNTLRMTY